MAQVPVYSWQAPVSTSTGIPTYFRLASPSEANLLQSSRFVSAPPISYFTPSTLLRYAAPSAGPLVTPTYVAAPQQPLTSMPGTIGTATYVAPTAPPEPLLTPPLPVTTPSAPLEPETPTTTDQTIKQDEPKLQNNLAVSDPVPFQACIPPTVRQEQDIQGDQIAAVIGAVSKSHADLVKRDEELYQAMQACAASSNVEDQVAALDKRFLQQAERRLQMALNVMTQLSETTEDVQVDIAIYSIMMHLRDVNNILQTAETEIQRLCPDTLFERSASKAVTEGATKYEELAVPRKLTKFFYETTRVPVKKGQKTTDLWTNKKVLSLSLDQGKQLFGKDVTGPAAFSEDRSALLDVTKGWNWGPWSLVWAAHSSPKQTFAARWNRLAFLDFRKRNPAAGPQYAEIDTDTSSRLQAAIDYMLIHVRSYLQEVNYVSREEWDKVWTVISQTSLASLPDAEGSQSSPPRQPGVLQAAFSETLVDERGIKYDRLTILQALQAMDAFYKNLDEHILWIGLAQVTTALQAKATLEKKMTLFSGGRKGSSDAAETRQITLFTKFYQSVAGLLNRLPVIPSVLKFVVQNSYSLFALLGLAGLLYLFGTTTGLPGLTHLATWFNASRILWLRALDCIQHIRTLLCQTRSFTVAVAAVTSLWNLFASKMGQKMSKTAVNLGGLIAYSTFLGLLCSMFPAGVGQTVPAETGKVTLGYKFGEGFSQQSTPSPTPTPQTAPEEGGKLGYVFGSGFSQQSTPAPTPQTAPEEGGKLGYVFGSGFSQQSTPAVTTPTVTTQALPAETGLALYTGSGVSLQAIPLRDIPASDKPPAEFIVSTQSVPDTALILSTAYPAGPPPEITQEDATLYATITGHLYNLTAVLGALTAGYGTVAASVVYALRQGGITTGLPGQ